MALWLFPGNITVCRASAEAAATCEHVQLLSTHPLSEAPKAVQVILRRAVRSKLREILQDPGMGMKDTALDKVPLNAIEIARPSKEDTLYVVAWDDPSFGVNGFNWIVEVKGTGAALLLSDHASSVAGGFGVTVLGTEKERYPEIMIASKGFADGGGALAEAGCFQKVECFYENTYCPVGCQDELNPQ